MWIITVMLGLPIDMLAIGTGFFYGFAGGAALCLSPIFSGRSV